MYDPANVNSSRKVSISLAGTSHPVPAHNSLCHIDVFFLLTSTCTHSKKETLFKMFRQTLLYSLSRSQQGGKDKVKRELSGVILNAMCTYTVQWHLYSIWKKHNESKWLKRNGTAHALHREVATVNSRPQKACCLLVSPAVGWHRPMACLNIRQLPPFPPKTALSSTVDHLFHLFLVIS